VGRHLFVYGLADAATALWSRRRVRDSANLQPRQRAAFGDSRFQRRAGLAGHRLSQRHRRAVHVTSRASGALARRRRARSTDHRRFSRERRR
jgi:hypothetical protein